MPPTDAEGYPPPSYLPLPAAYQPTRQDIPIYSYSLSSEAWDSESISACTHCKRGDHDQCVDWFCWCTQSYDEQPCSLHKRKARALAAGVPWHEPKY